MRHRMVLASLIVFAFAAATGARAADTYQVDRSHSSVEFKIRHLISNVTGRFTDFSGTIEMDPADPTRSAVTFSVKTASIDTNEPKRDDHLRSQDFFDVAKFPEMTFRSSKIVKGAGNTYQVTGMLTLHGVTKEVTVPVEFLGAAKDPWGNTRAGFSAGFTLNRQDYGLKWNKTLEAGGLLVGNEVTATVNVSAIQAKKDTPPPVK